MVDSTLTYHDGRYTEQTPNKVENLLPPIKNRNENINGQLN